MVAVQCEVEDVRARLQRAFWGLNVMLAFNFDRKHL
jgi:hypothetical protein